MIEVSGTAAARIALARGKLGCPGCGQPLRPWGHARERTVRDHCLFGFKGSFLPNGRWYSSCVAFELVAIPGLLGDKVSGAHKLPWGNRRPDRHPEDIPDHYRTRQPAAREPSTRHCQCRHGPPLGFSVNA